MNDEKRFGTSEDTYNELQVLMDSWGRELHTEFLSDLNRRRQNILLVSSIFTLLISFTIITPVEASISGIKISLTNTQVLPVLSAAICLYYLVMYYLGISQDSIRFHYQTQPAIRAVLRLLDEVLREEYPTSDKQNITLKHLKELMSREKEKSGAVEDLEKGIKELKLFSDAAIEEMFQPPKADREFENFYRRKADALHLFADTFQRYSKLTWWKRLLEIIFPIGLSLFAIGSAVWAVFLR